MARKVSTGRGSLAMDSPKPSSLGNVSVGASDVICNGHGEHLSVAV